MYTHIIAAGAPNGSWQYATESWSTGGVILGLVILFVVIAAAAGIAKAVS